MLIYSHNYRVFQNTPPPFSRLRQKHHPFLTSIESTTMSQVPYVLCPKYKAKHELRQNNTGIWSLWKENSSVPFSHHLQSPPDISPDRYPYLNIRLRNPTNMVMSSRPACLHGSAAASPQTHILSCGDGLCVVHAERCLPDRKN